MKSLLITLLLFLASVSAASPQSKGETSNREIAWAIDAHPSDASPSAWVFLSFHGKKVRIVKVGNIPHAITGTERATYGVPKSALTACYGWWAGSGDVFYAIKKGHSLRVYHRSLDEQEGTPDRFHLVKTIRLDRPE